MLLFCFLVVAGISHHSNMPIAIITLLMIIFILFGRLTVEQHQQSNQLTILIFKWLSPRQDLFPPFHFLAVAFALMVLDKYD